MDAPSVRSLFGLFFVWPQTRKYPPTPPTVETALTYPMRLRIPDGERGGRAHGPDHPPDEPGFQIRELDPHARRSQE